MFMDGEDTSYLNKNMTRILFDIATQYEECDIVEGVKVSDILRREELLNNTASCWACGPSVHEREIAEDAKNFTAPVVIGVDTV